jgi:tetratricopeptide (TPR) repeat protein
LAGSVFSFWQSRQYYRPSTEALRWYDAGVAALREGNNVKATRSLQESLNQDSHFVMAHARLAEAWANLDFDGNAQRELLVATPGGRQLQPLDRMYLDAIHATVTKDFPAEIAIYRQILDRLPPDQRSSGYVDLGVAYERAGDPKHALENYARAASLDSDNPAPFMHTAVLQSRQHHVPEADRAFERAQTLLTAEMNQEGLAELDYDRGYAANDGGDAAGAKPFLERSLEEARKIPSVQLEIRVLTQLSSVAYRSDKNQAAKYAEQSIRLARENQLDAWAANGLVRLASAEILQGKLDDAESSLNEALQISHQTQQLRSEAMANLILASLMNQRQLADKVIGPAQSALDYYQKNGFFGPAANASTLIIRTQRDKGQYQQALEAGDAFLAMTTRSGVRPLILQAEEVVGTVLLQMEHYPDALAHFEKAESLADTPVDKAYQSVHLADVLWRLGRYENSDAALQIEPANQFQAAKIGEIRTLSLLSRGRYKQALAVIEDLTSRYPTVVASSQKEFELDRAIAESHLGMKKEALADLNGLERPSRSGDRNEDAANEIGIAEASLNAGLAQQARDAASKAATYYASMGQLDSELRSVCIAAAASKALNNSPEFSSYSRKGVDILSQIKQTWSSQEYQTYLSRPDIRILIGRSSVADLPNRRSQGD